MLTTSLKSFRVQMEKLDCEFPTHRHSPKFWEALGRAVGSFGFLESVLKRAILAFVMTKKVSENEMEIEFENCSKVIMKASSDQFGGLIRTFDNVVRAHSDACVDDLQALIDSLEKAAEIRNVLCHAAWKIPDEQGHSLPEMIDRKMRVFVTPIGIDYLCQLRQHTAELSCAVMNTVTGMGYQFPGSSGQGKSIL